MKKIIVTIGAVLIIIVGIIFGTQHYFTEKQHEEYLSEFLQYTQMAVDAWERYEETDDFLYYQHGVVNFYIAVDYFERYSYAKMDGFSHEFMAFNEIRLDMFSDVTVVRPYLAKLKEALAEFDDTYLFGSHELFLKIFEIYADLIHNRKETTA